MVTTGLLAEHACRTIHTDIMLFSAHAVDRNGQITDLHEHETNLRKIAMEHTKKTVFLCDSSKFDKTSVFQVCHTSELDCVITDRLPTPDAADGFQAKNLLVCEP